MTHEIIQVVPRDNYTVWVYFADGKITCYDVKPNMEKGLFKKLNDISVFMHKCKIMNDTLAWDIGEAGEDDCLDIAPEVLYECPEVYE
ncbi:DUF2442 domain-containing protein [Pseudobutyrivibrio sp.]|uniref:DUF2442 domain-containing protein n=1 Tax=Pseudobutyrivibrio sp. TaxID=2014367 RepID=UPI001E0E2AEC|nr:DUF2442 domain-containing protein [Pseudobutyrivibrio sp.]MBE5910938.1 DUF2442 domain-containing protein [Pseudobutyrivibrio sp.]